MSNLFPDGVCVIACSGPSLNKVDCFSLGVPVVVISTAIRTLKKGDYWVLADMLNQMHGDEGKVAWQDENIKKVIANSKNNRTKFSPRKDFILVDCNETNKANDDVDRILYDPKKPLIRGPHKSVTMAIQWAHTRGANNLIFVGNDLHADSMETKYSYDAKEFDLKKKHNFKKTLDQVKTCFDGWYPLAKRKGFEWYSWECGSVFSSMVPSFQPNMLDEIKKKHIIPDETIPTTVNQYTSPQKSKIIKIKRSDGKYSYITQKVMDRIEDGKQR
jgi:hypothetical protein